MRPERLEFCGLKSYSEKAVIDFSALSTYGIFGVFGDTGSGKSTILDAVFYALYGDFPEKISSNDEFINKKAGGLNVDFVFSVKENGTKVFYRVKREWKLKAPTAKTQPTAKAVLSRFEGNLEYPVADGTSAVNEAIENLLGLTLKQFIKCIVLPQGEFSAFLTMQKGERLKIISALFDLEKYGRYLSMKLSMELKSIDAETQMTAGQLESFSDFDKERLDKAVEDEKAAKTAYDEYVVINGKIRDNFNNFKDNYVRHNKLAELYKSKAALDVIRPGIERKTQYLNAYHKAAASIELYDKLQQKERESKALEAKKIKTEKDLSDLEVKAEKAEKAYAGVPDKRELCDKIKACYNSLRMLSRDYSSIEASRKAISDMSCLITTEDKAVSDTEKDLAAAMENLTASEKKIEEFAFKDRLTAAMEKLSHFSKVSFIDEETEFLRALSFTAAGYENVAKMIDERITVLAAAKGENTSDYESELKNLKRLLEQNEKLSDELSAVRDEIARLERYLSEQKAKKLATVTELKATKEKVNAFDDKWKEIISELKSETGVDLGDSFVSAGRSAGALSDSLEKEISALTEEYEKTANELPLLRQKAGFDLKNLEKAKKEADDMQIELDKKLDGMLIPYAREIVSAVGDYETLRLEIERYNADKLSVENQIFQNAENLPEGDYSKENFERMSGEVKASDDKKQLLYEIYIKLQKDSEIISQNYEKRCIIEKDYKKLLDKKSVYDKLAEAIKYNKLTEYVADEYLSEICVDAERTLSTLSSGKYGLRYDGDFFVVDNLNGGMLRKTATVSGGELFLVSLSLALALSASIIAKSNKPIEFFFLDEGFGSLDASLVETVVDSLEKLKSSNYTIGLISHVEALKERISAKITVGAPTMTKGSSLTVSV